MYLVLISFIICSIGFSQDLKKLANSNSDIYRSMNLIMESDVNDNGTGSYFGWTKKSRVKEKERLSKYEYFVDGKQLIYAQAVYNEYGTFISLDAMFSKYVIETKNGISTEKRIDYQNLVFDVNRNILYDYLELSRIRNLPLNRETETKKDSMENIFKLATKVINKTSWDSDRRSMMKRANGGPYNPTNEEIEKTVYSFFIELKKYIKE